MSDEDNLDWEEWMKLSKAQQDAQLARTMKEYNDWYDSLPLAVQQRHIIRGKLRLLVKMCKTLKQFPGLQDFWCTRIKGTQRRLLKDRIWRHTGIYPGEG